MKLNEISRGFMLRAAIGCMSRERRRTAPLWSLVREICGVGSGSGHAICRELGWNPDAKGTDELPPEKPESINPWSKEAPAAEGVYDFRCDETNREVEIVKIYTFNGELWIKDKTLGQNPLNHFHSNLMDPEWRLISPL